MSHFTAALINNLLIDHSFFHVYTCLGVEWAAASGKDSASLGWASCGSPGSVVMVIHLGDSDVMVTMELLIGSLSGRTHRLQSDFFL